MRKRNREVYVAAISQGQIRDRGTPAYLEESLERLEWASYGRPDIICLPENLPGYTKETAQPLPCPLTDRLGAWAREKNCYVIVPYRIQDGDR